MTKALFLDRDGVVNVEKDYLYKIEDFEFINGIIELCKHYQDKDYIIVIVTNQSGIARGFYTEKDFSILTEWMINQFSLYGISIEKVYFCPHHPDISGVCSCRKPSPGMLLDAKNDFNIDLASSLLIGDKERDIQAGISAGLRETYLFDAENNCINSQATKVVTKLDQIWKI